MHSPMIVFGNIFSRKRLIKVNVEAFSRRTVKYHSSS